jgi:hypothetical protein
MELCAMFGVPECELDAVVATNYGDFRKDGTMSSVTARKIVDQRALAGLRETLDSPHHPRNHERHDLTISPTFGPYCRECRIPLFRAPESVQAILDGINGNDPETIRRAELAAADIRELLAN